MTDITQQVIDWYGHAGRHDLPWQQDITPYRVWLSEIMLQQTQVSTVIPYFHRFIGHFPDINALAAADQDTVLHLWSGLGYYSRARNLHKTAGIISKEFGGEFPDNLEGLQRLPGIGRSTAGAILALSMDQVQPILDGNVKRVLCRYYVVREWPGERKTEKYLWQLAEKNVSTEQPRAYTQGIMDLGATVCTRARPDCEACPLHSGCLARQQGLQHELPLKRARKAVPVRQTRFVMIENNNGEVLLQKRPPAGIWGGLWSFPECSVDTNVAGWLENNYGFTVDTIRQVRGLRHTFTHFRLDISPVRTKLVSQQNKVLDEENLYWFNPSGDNKLIGMATPVKTLVDRHFLTQEGV